MSVDWKICIWNDWLLFCSLFSKCSAVAKNLSIYLPAVDRCQWRALLEAPLQEVSKATLYFLLVLSTFTNMPFWHVCNSCLCNVFSGKVISSRVSSTPGALQRSRSDVDVNAASSAKSRMSTATSPSPFSSAAALPPGSYASLGKASSHSIHLFSSFILN